MKIFSLDAETNGLWGQAFAISAAVYTDGAMIATFTGYLGADGVTDSWVKDNVLPKLEGLEQTHESYDEMLADFASFYMKHKKDADVIAHMGVPVEAKVLVDMQSKGFIGEWDGPYPFLDVAGVLKAHGYDPTSVDRYNAQHDLMVGRSEAEGLEAHHPLYDSIAAAVAYMHLMHERGNSAQNFLLSILDKKITEVTVAEWAYVDSLRESRRGNFHAFLTRNRGYPKEDPTEGALPFD